MMKKKEKDLHYIKMAVELATNGVKTGEGGPFGCVIVRGDEIVGKGNNRVTSTNDPTAHAEVVAIRDACKNVGHFQLDDCTIYTSCEPCPMCLGAIYWARPARIVFACTKKDAAAIQFDDQFIYDEIELPVSDRNIPTEQVGRDIAISVFELWASMDDKTEY